MDRYCAWFESPANVGANRPIRDRDSTIIRGRFSAGGIAYRYLKGQRAKVMSDMEEIKP
jgi:hypothetical protein